MRQYLNDNWYFTEQYHERQKTITRIEAQKTMQQVRLPHTVKLMQENYCSELDYQMESGYVHFLEAPDDWKGKKVLLNFGAVAHETEVFCNGQLAASHHCGYTAFTADISELLHYGEDNVIAVRVDSRESLNVPPFGLVIDYMTFGGIYRSVSMEVKEPSRLTDLFVYGDRDGVAHVQLEGEQTEDCEIEVLVETEVSAIRSEKPDSHAVTMRKEYQSSFELEVPDAKLWDIRRPNLYRITVWLIRNGARIDEISTRFGFREVQLSAEGFFLNGKRLKLRGLNRHQSWPYMGYAVPDRAQALDADILKYELGCNAVRTSHYPQSPAFIDRCDEIGLLVFTEIPGWQHIGDAAWKEQAVENTREMVLQYRNHPSIFLWGVRINESQDDDELYRRTNETAHALDPTRPTGGVRCIKKSHLYEDVYTYNDFVHNGTNVGCEPKSAVTSDKAKGYLISEYGGHMFPTKPGDWEEKRQEHALRHAKVLDAVRSHREIAGSFGWCMFDYNTHQDFGSGDRICYHGVLDIFRNPKMAAAVYAAEGLQEPVLEVGSSMDIGEHPAGSLGEIYVFTNADEVELNKNEEYVKTFYPGGQYPHMKHPPIWIDDTIGGLMEKHEGFDHQTSEEVKKVLAGVAKNGQAALPVSTMITAGKLMAFKHFNYEKGHELYGKYVANWGGVRTEWTFVAKKSGKVVRSVQKGCVTDTHLEVKCDTDTLTENGTWDMATIRVRSVDQNGNLTPYLHRTLNLETEGPIELIGPKHVAFDGGMTGTYVRTTGESGIAHLHLGVDGMEPVTLTFRVMAGNK